MPDCLVLSVYRAYVVNLVLEISEGVVLVHFEQNEPKCLFGQYNVGSGAKCEARNAFQFIFITIIREVCAYEFNQMLKLTGCRVEGQMNG